MNGATIPGSGNSPVDPPGAAYAPPSMPPPIVAENALRSPHSEPVPQDRPAEDVSNTLEVSETTDVKREWFNDSRLRCSLISTILHTLAFIVLALLTYGTVTGPSSILVLQGEQTEPIEDVTFEIIKENEEDDFDHESSLAEKPVNVSVSSSDTSQSVQSPLQSEAVSAMDPTDIGLLAAGSVQPTNNRIQRLPGGGLAGRTPVGRKELGEKFGATPQSEAAVEMALEWLAAHQRRNGSWSFNLQLDPCNGRCRHGKGRDQDTPTPTTAATGLALLAFLGAGHTHHDGPHAETVRKGLYYLREAGAESENGLDWQHGSMYGHGIALMATAEALSMTTVNDQYDTDLKDIVERATFFTVVAQHQNGSWGYVPGSPGDTTLTGWQVLSLLAARRNGVSLRSDTLRRAKEFVMSVKVEDEWSFGYKGPPSEPTMDAIALTLLLYLGQTPGYTPFDRALDRLAERGPTKTNVYHDYYATLALHHSRHRDWDVWNNELRDHLVRSQSTQGHERGSWHFKDKWGDVGGRVYTTAMCAMILEVYYRYLPLYDKIEDFPL